MKKVFLFFLSMLLLQPFTVAVINNKAQAATIEVLEHYELGSYSGTLVDVNKQRNWVLTKSGTTYRIYNYTTGSLVTSFTADEVLSRSFRDDVDAMGTNTRMYYRNGDTVYYRDKNNITVEKELFTVQNTRNGEVFENFVASQDRIAFVHRGYEWSDWPIYDDVARIEVYDAWNGSFIHYKMPTQGVIESYDLAIGRNGMVGYFYKEKYSSSKDYIRAEWFGRDDINQIKKETSQYRSYLNVRFIAASSTIYSSVTYGSSTKYFYVYRGTSQVYYRTSSSSFNHIKYNDEANAIMIDNVWRPISNIGSTVGVIPIVPIKFEILDSSANLITAHEASHYYPNTGVDDFLPNSIRYKEATHLLEIAPKQGVLSSTDQNKVVIYLENGDIVYFQKSGSAIYMDKKVSTLNSNYHLLEYDSTNNMIWAVDTYNKKIVKMVASQIVTEGNVTQIINDSPAINDIQNDITSINNTLSNKLELSDLVGSAENLIPNGDFELGTKGWVVSSNSYSGTATAILKSSAQSGQKVYTTTKRINLVSEDYIPIDVNKKYKLEGYFRDIGSNPYGIYLGLRYYDGNKSQISYNYPAAANKNPTTSWTKYEGYIGGNSSFQFPSGTKFVRIHIWTNYNTSSSVTTEIDNIRLTTGGDLYSIDPTAYNQLQNVDTRVTELEKDKIAPIIYEIDTVTENKSVVDLSSEGNSIQLLIQAQDDRAALNQMQYSYRRNNGSWSSWAGIPSNGQISVSVGNGANTYEFKVRDNASPANESLIYKFNRTIWGL